MINTLKDMKIPILTLSLAIILTLSSQISAAMLEWDRTEATLDLEPDQALIRASFKVTNRGEEPVRINRIQTSCGCTGSVVDRKIMNPGESTEIIGTFKRGKRQGVSTNRLKVYLDGESEPTKTLTMTVRIPKLIDAKPQIVYWTPSSGDVERQVRVTLDERYVNKIEGLNYDQSRLDVTLERVKGEAVEYLLKITPKPSEEGYRGTITINAEGPQRKEQSGVHAFLQR